MSAASRACTPHRFDVLSLRDGGVPDGVDGAAALVAKVLRLTD